MPEYIIISPDGHTFSPSSEGADPDIENMQVIGFSEGKDGKEALEKLLKENRDIEKLGYRDFLCIEMKDSFRFSISELSQKL